MTERLYYSDPALTEFDATVAGVEQLGNLPAVLLDRTAFYPTSGGQPHDTGSLNGIHVSEVVERDDGAILHVVEQAIAVGEAVHGVVDWARRFDHMQQHTGQHILSAAFDRLWHAKTVGFHLGAEVSSLDLDRELPPQAIASAEEEANRIVWQDRPVSIRFVSSEEAAGLGLRKDPGRSGVLRVIGVEGFDLSACGGTHVARSGEVGIIVVSAWEKLRGGARLEFLCGGRAQRSYRLLRDSVAGCIRRLSVAPDELPAAIERAQEENKDLRKTIRAQQERLAGFEGLALAARAEAAGGRRVVVEALDGWDANGLKAMAVSIVSKPGFRVALFSTSQPVLAVVAGSSDASLDARAVLAALVGRFGGKGGGKPDLAQGGGLTGNLQEMLAAARAVLLA